MGRLYRRDSPAAPVRFGKCLRKVGFLGARCEGNDFSTYDILKKEHNNFMWVEAAHDIQPAKERVCELSQNSDVEVVIFNERTLDISHGPLA
jgi:hypothetical protein